MSGALLLSCVALWEAYIVHVEGRGVLDVNVTDLYVRAAHIHLPGVVHVQFGRYLLRPCGEIHRPPMAPLTCRRGSTLPDAFVRACVQLWRSAADGDWDLRCVDVASLRVLRCYFSEEFLRVEFDWSR